MTKDRIIEVMKKNPDLPYTSAQIRSLLGKPPLCSVNRALKLLVEGGLLTKKPDPFFPKRMLYLLTDYASTTHRLLTDYSFYRKPFIYTNIRNEIYKENGFFSPLLDKLDSLLQKFLNEGGREILASAPDDTIKKIERIFDEQVFPLLRSPVLGSTDAPAKPIPGPVSLDSPTEAAPASELALKTPIPGPSEDVLRRAFPKGLPGVKKTSKEPEPKTTSYRRSRSKIIQQKELSINASPFNPHIRYYMLTPEQRNFEFARVWHKILAKFFPSITIKTSYEMALVSLTNFRATKSFRNLMRNARVEADLLHARYEDYMVGIVEYYFERNSKHGRDMSPLPGVLAGEVHVAAAKDYIELSLKGKILITLDDIRYSGNADFFLDYGAATPEQRNKANIFYQESLFPQIERVAASSGHRLLDLVTYSITYGLMPKEWSEGFGTIHHLDALSGYHYSGPRDIPSALFRHIQE